MEARTALVQAVRVDVVLFSAREIDLRQPNKPASGVRAMHATLIPRRLHLCWVALVLVEIPQRQAAVLTNSDLHKHRHSTHSRSVNGKVVWRKQVSKWRSHHRRRQRRQEQHVPNCAHRRHSVSTWPHERGMELGTGLPVDECACSEHVGVELCRTSHRLKMPSAEPAFEKQVCGKMSTCAKERVTWSCTGRDCEWPRRVRTQARQRAAIGAATQQQNARLSLTKAAMRTMRTQCTRWLRACSATAGPTAITSRPCQPANEITKLSPS